MTPDILYDQLIGMGVARRLVFSYGGNPGVGSLHRFRDAIENDWPAPIEIEEHSHAGMANRYAAGAADMPCALMRGYAAPTSRATRGSPHQLPVHRRAADAVPALRPDVAIVHAQEADGEGNVALWGIPGVQKEAVLAARRSLVTVERIVEGSRRAPARSSSPAGRSMPWRSRRVARALLHARLHRARQRLLREWDAISRDRDDFRAWMEQHVLAMAAPDERGGDDSRRRAGRSFRRSQRRARCAETQRVHRRRAAEHGGVARARGAQPGARAGLRVGHDRREAAPHPAVDRRRRAGAHGRRRRPGA